MKLKKVLVISILGPILILASLFVIFREHANISAQSGREAQAVQSNGNTVKTVSIYQTPLAALTDGLNKLGTIEKSQASDHIYFDSKGLINNTWGAPSEEKLSSGIYLNKDKTFGWYWDRPDPLRKSGINCFQPIYPSIRTGSPWESSRTTYFPVKVSEVKTLKFDVEYSYPVPPAGTYNLAYDMFLSGTNQASSDPRPKAEIMIWLHHTLQQPPEVYKGDFSDGINTYKLYSFTMPNGRLYYAFVMKEQTPLKAHHIVDAKKLMDNLGLDSNWYLHGVELGNEVVSGSGKIEISKLIVILNGHEL